MKQAFEMLNRIWNHPANAQRPWAGLSRYVRWQFNKRVLRRDLPFDFHGFTLPGYSDSHSMNAAYIDNVIAIFRDEKPVVEERLASAPRSSEKRS